MLHIFQSGINFNDLFFYYDTGVRCHRKYERVLTGNFMWTTNFQEWGMLNYKRKLIRYANLNVNMYEETLTYCVFGKICLKIVQLEGSRMNRIL